ncbi:hypothetical protein QTP86_025473 [Hemibagrus guttatus]|nr:hypothetical protein QTP86_025473 [Hemibagrus guttatus]
MNSELLKQKGMGNSACNPDCPALPRDVIEEIFLNLPGQQVILVCRLVCTEWRSVVDSSAFWRKRCRREGFKPLNIHKAPRDWQEYYFLSKKQRNLLKNPNAEEGFTGWNIVENGGDKWVVDNMYAPHPDETVTKCFVTSYRYAPRWDCGSEYEIRVELLNRKKKTVQFFQPEPVEFPQWNDQQWEQCPALPRDVIEEIFLNLPGQQVILVCRLVCTEWRSVVDSSAFWRKRCRREGFKPLNIHKAPRDWQEYYFLCKKRRNLLKNPNAEEGFTGWNIVENGGDKWVVDNTFAPHPDETVTKCFVTSYRRCIKSQLIDLEKEGYSPAFMDEIQPDIVISDWYAPRWDCGSEYEIRVELLNRKKKTVQFFQPEPVEFPQWNDQQWEQMTYTFKDYGRGVRFIRFKHGGKDTQFWAGHYGIRKAYRGNVENGVCRMLVRKIGQQLGRPTQSLLGWLTSKFLKRYNQILEENAVKLCEIQPDETVLELGHGPGLGLQEAVQRLTGPRGKLLGVDYSNYMHHMATKSMQGLVASGKVALYCCDVAAMPIEDNSVDKVFHCNCYYFWPDLKTAASEIYRVMKPDALMVTTLRLDRIVSFASKNVFYGIIDVDEGNMQRNSRLKRELHMLSTEPPPGVSCWQMDERVEELQARQYTENLPESVVHSVVMQPVF